MQYPHLETPETLAEVLADQLEERAINAISDWTGIGGDVVDEDNHLAIGCGFCEFEDHETHSDCRRNWVNAFTLRIRLAVKRETELMAIVHGSER